VSATELSDCSVVATTVAVAPVTKANSNAERIKSFRGGFYRCVSPWWHLLHRLRRADGYGHLPAITKTSPIVAHFGGGK